jgi:ribosomal protection tetracycline resistance protein
MSKSIINIGILAHVDAGKTTITEQLLYLGGAVKEIGNVDKGSATTDRLSIEKLRGISVKTDTASFKWKETQINLIDTPGHADFVSEIERALQILDCAVLVISSVEGLQSHTYLIWDILKTLKIPTFIFINKVDRPGSQYEQILDSLNKEFKANIFPLSFVIDEAEKEANIADYKHDDFALLSNFEANITAVAEHDENILNLYLEGEKVETKLLYQKAIENFQDGKLTPVIAGSAKNAIGTADLLDHLISFIKKPVYEPQKEVSAIVYKTEHDQKIGLLSHIKILAGTLQNKDLIFNQRLTKDFKISQIKKRTLNKIHDLDFLTAGDIGIIAGQTEFRIGDILGKAKQSLHEFKLQESVLSTRVKPVNESELAQLAIALNELSIEDPDLDFKWHKQENELQLKLQGPIQKEILQEFLLERYHLDSIFEDPTVIYKETPKKKAFGFADYTMPKPSWAVLKFEIEPGERGSGVVYESKVGVNDILQKYQNEVTETIPKALEQGMKGWEVTDIKIKLIAGEDHVMHSNPGNFILATPMGIMDALKNSETQLLEPILNFTIKANESLLGSINSELIQMRAEIFSPTFLDDQFELKGTVPVATSLDFSIRLNSISSGKAKYFISFSGYHECTDKEGTIRSFKGVNPLDKSLWILHNRGAYKV